MTVTFCQVRPGVDDVTEIWAATRRKEGTLVAELASLGRTPRAAVLAGGLLPVSSASDLDDPEPVAWVLEPPVAIELARAGIPGWRITVRDEGSAEAILDAVARTGAAFLRTGRSRVRRAAGIVSLPAVSTRVSVFVDTVEEALAAVADGAGDLLLRGWDGESIGLLRDSLPAGQLVERTALPIGVNLDEARQVLDGELFTAYLNQIDGSGVARPRYDWAPGKPTDPPVPARPAIAANGLTRPGRGARQASGIEGLDPDLQRILTRSLAGTAPSRDEIERLFFARGHEVEAIASVADELRRRANGETVTYVVNRNINYTNQCYFRCGFCAFSKGPRSLNLRGDPYLLSLDEVAERSREAWERGATEVTPPGRHSPRVRRRLLRSRCRAHQGDGPRDAHPRLHPTRGVAGSRHHRGDRPRVPCPPQEAPGSARCPALPLRSSTTTCAATCAPTRSPPPSGPTSWFRPTRWGCDRPQPSCSVTSTGPARGPTTSRCCETFSAEPAGSPSSFRCPFVHMGAPDLPAGPGPARPDLG